MKILITQDTFVPSIDGPEFVGIHETVEVEADTGHAVVNAGKALYIDQKDVKGRPIHLLASEQRLKVATEALAAAAKAAKAGKAEKAEA